MADLTSFNGKIILIESERTKTEVWTRVMGYHRPISEFNPGKKSEHFERVHFRVKYDADQDGGIDGNFRRFR